MRRPLRIVETLISGLWSLVSGLWPLVSVVSVVSVAEKSTAAGCEETDRGEEVECADRECDLEGVEVPNQQEGEEDAAYAGAEGF